MTRSPLLSGGHQRHLAGRHPSGRRVRVRPQQSHRHAGRRDAFRRDGGRVGEVLRRSGLILRHESCAQLRVRGCGARHPLGHGDRVLRDPEHRHRRRRAAPHRHRDDVHSGREPARTASCSQRGKQSQRRESGPGARGVQTVGAHWKRQAHGPRRSQRRWIVIAPYERGPKPEPDQIVMTPLAERQDAANAR